MKTRFFGAHLACEMDPNVECVLVPVGELCAWCETRIEAHDRGYMIPHISLETRDDPQHGGETLPVLAGERPHHIECFVRMLVGSVGHQLQRCHCYGGELEDRPGRTKREAALDAYLLFINRMQVGRQ